MKSLDQKIKGLSASRRKRVEARAAQLIGEEMTLRELRRARKVTQVRIARALGIRQDGVSRLEKRSDLLLSTLRKAVRALGGELQLVAAFPDRPPVVLSGIATTDPSEHRGRAARKLKGIWKGKGFERIGVEKEIRVVRQELGEQLRKRGKRFNSR
jgi:transcriptional regulator with XRE-family HTH domain